MTSTKANGSIEAAQETARAAGLRYVSDADEGIRRRRCGKGFTFVDGRGSTVRDEATRKRIAELAIPPGWKEVWICTRPDGHVQVTGRDDEGRKQYIYHPRWRAAREREKYERLREFGLRLPVVRQRVGRDLSRTSHSKERAVAGVIRLLDMAAIRVGNEEYAQDNDSYGVTTLRDRHVNVRGERIRLSFTGKSGKEVDFEIRDRSLARLLRELCRLPGEEVFCYRNGDSGLSRVTSGDVNDYLREASGADITAKDFRTWAASVHALNLLAAAPDDLSDAERRALALEVLDESAELLANTRATAREFYVHPGLLRAYEEGALGGLLGRASDQRRDIRRPGFRQGEALFLALLPKLESFVEAVD